MRIDIVPVLFLSAVLRQLTSAGKLLVPAQRNSSGKIIYLAILLA